MQTYYTLSWQVEGQGKTYTLTADRRCVIGRERSLCNIVVNASTVSRQHAAIDRVGETYYLYNLSQTNSIHVNGQTRLGYNQSAPLKNGDTFRLGSITFQVLEVRQPLVKKLKLRCAHCNRIVDYTPEAFCPWCGRALSNAESMFTEE